jgi:Ras-related protein Rab-6A
VYYLDRQVSIEEGDAKAREFGVMFIETSAKAGFNIKVSPSRCSSQLISAMSGSSSFTEIYMFLGDFFAINSEESVLGKNGCVPHARSQSHIYRVGWNDLMLVTWMRGRHCFGRLQLHCLEWRLYHQQSRMTWLIST